MSGEPELGIRRGEKGMHSLNRLEDGERMRVVVREAQVRQGGEPTLDDLRDAMLAVWGTDYGLHDATGSRAGPTRRGRPRPIAPGVCCWPATPRTYMPRRADRASTPVSRTP